MFARIPPRYALSTAAIEQSSILPFLYRTRTIRRGYADTAFETSTDAANNRDALPNTQFYKPSQPANPRSRPKDEDHSQWGKANANPGYASPDQVARPRSRIPREEHAREDFVPFEGLKSPDPHAEFEGSTITPNERKTFETLFKLRKRREAEEEQLADEFRSSPIRKSTPREKSSSLDDIMTEAVDNIEAEEEEQADLHLDREDSTLPPALQSLAERTQSKRWEDIVKDPRTKNPNTALNAAAHRENTRIGRLLGRAQTDVQVWRILQEHVLKPVTALRLDASPSLPPTPPDKKKARPFTHLDFITITLPQSLIRISRHLHHHHPSSPLALALLPHLRTYGPMAFALGATTQLYNLHMRLLYTTYLDLGAVCAMLEEMDAMVFEFDEGTVVLLQQILRDADIASRGPPDVRWVWGGVGVGKVREWVERVKGRREEEALRRVKTADGV